MPPTKKDLLRPIGLIGLGLMGRGIAACLLAQGWNVVAYDRAQARGRESIRHLGHALRELAHRGIISKERVRGWRRRFEITDSVAGLAVCGFVIESVVEDLRIKGEIFKEVERVVSPDAVVASNTSSIPITVLQAGRKHPGRFVGMHWGEPAQIMRYLEIIPGRRTTKGTLRMARQFAESCGKEPTVLREDICGFLSNRMMYAMIREAMHLVEAGVADIESVDRSFRNDIGWWALLAGPFRWMDLTGIPAYAAVMEGLLPKLCNERKVPRLMREAVSRGAKGVANAKGFYPYTRKSARQWEKDWVEFTYDIRKLADKYAR